MLRIDHHESNKLIASFGLPMRFSEYTDHTLRVLMYCGMHRDRLFTIGELAEHRGMSKNHLMKVVNGLAHQGLIVTMRGPSSPPQIHLPGITAVLTRGPPCHSPTFT